MNDVLEYLLIASLADSIFEHMQHKTTINKEKQYARVAYLLFHRVQLNECTILCHIIMCVCAKFYPWLFQCSIFHSNDLYRICMISILSFFSTDSFNFIGTPFKWKMLKCHATLFTLVVFFYSFFCFGFVWLHIFLFISARVCAFVDGLIYFYTHFLKTFKRRTNTSVSNS